MKIYQMAIAPNPRRVRIFLAEKGIDVPYVELDLKSGEQFSAEFKKKNPFALVPVLELDDGTCISESVAICRYFEEIQPEPPLFGRNPVEKARIEMWNRLVELNFLLPTGMCFQHTTDYFKAFKKQVPEWGELCRERAAGFFEKLNEHLANQPYVAGENYSIADITALCTVDFSRVNQLRIQEHHIHLRSWYERVSQRPSAKA